MAPAPALVTSGFLGQPARASDATSTAMVKKR
jgi:hypothetical protein